MTASVNVNQVRELTRALYQTAVDAFDEGKQAARQLALLQSLSMLIDRMQSAGHIDPLVTWAGEVLLMLEDCCGEACPDGDERAAQTIYQAISHVQAALGVPEDKRAWVFDAEASAASAPAPAVDAGVPLGAGGVEGMPGEVGRRGRIACDAGCEIEQTALILLDLLATEKVARFRVYSTMLQRIRHLGCVVISSMNDDGELPELVARLQ